MRAKKVVKKAVKPMNKTGFRGVVEVTGKYEARLTAKGKSYRLGSFHNVEVAARMYDKAAIKHFGKEAKLNFPKQAKKALEYKSPEGVNYKSNTSGYRGVEYAAGKWKASMRHEGEFVYVGRFESAEEAAEAYDIEAKKLKGSKAKLNYPA